MASFLSVGQEGRGARRPSSSAALQPTMRQKALLTYRICPLWLTVWWVFLIMVTYTPQISLFLPDLMMGT